MAVPFIDERCFLRKAPSASTSSFSARLPGMAPCGREGTHAAWLQALRASSGVRTRRVVDRLGSGSVIAASFAGSYRLISRKKRACVARASVRPRAGHAHA